MSSNDLIAFNQPHMTGQELEAIESAIADGKLHGDGRYTEVCQDWFKAKLAADSAFLTGSCTLALDMAAIVAGIGSGDEVLVPDFTFVSSAQAFALRGAVPVLCDVRSDTLNLDETRLEEALTENTRAIVPVHYAGIAADMDAICAFAQKHDLLIIEDAAQAIGCTYKGQPVGSHGDMATFSFHATKNIHCGEGGMLVVNNPQYTDRAAIAWEKGTDRRQFLEGNVEKYQWKALGSSFLASEVTAAMLSAQLASEEQINDRRRTIWNRYFDAFATAEQRGVVKCPGVPNEAKHNGHLFYLLLPYTETRKAMIKHMHDCGVQTVFHYTPLHESDGGREYCRQGMPLQNAATLPHQLLRLPLYPDLTDDEQEKVIAAALQFLDRL